MIRQTRSLGKTIRDRRIELRLTQEALAERIGDGVRQSDVSRLERDRIQLPRAQRLRAIAQALEMEPGELLVKSGWEGALSDWESDPAEIGQFEAERPLSEFESTVQADDAVEMHGRLRQALEDSAHLREQTVETMRRAEEVGRTWEQLYGGGTPGSSEPAHR